MNAIGSIGLTFLRDVLASFRESDASGDRAAASARSMLVRFNVNPSPVQPAEKDYLFLFCASIAVRCMNESGMRVVYPDSLPYSQMVQVMNALSSQYRGDGDLALTSTKLEDYPGGMATPAQPDILHASGDFGYIIPANFDYEVPRAYRMGAGVFILYIPQRGHVFQIRGVSTTIVTWTQMRTLAYAHDALGAVQYYTFQDATVNADGVNLVRNTKTAVTANDDDVINLQCEVPGGVLEPPRHAGSWIRISFENSLAYSNQVRNDYMTQAGQELISLLNLVIINPRVQTFVNSTYGPDRASRLAIIMNTRAETKWMWSQLLQVMLGIATALNL